MFSPISTHLRQFVRKVSTNHQALTAASSSTTNSSFARATAERKLNKTELDFMKLIEKQNLQRVTKLRQQRQRNTYTGLIIGASVLGIYLYSMLAVKQERFLDDFNEPQKVSAAE